MTRIFERSDYLLSVNQFVHLSQSNNISLESDI